MGPRALVLCCRRRGGGFTGRAQSSAEAPRSSFFYTSSTSSGTGSAGKAGLLFDATATPPTVTGLAALSPLRGEVQVGSVDFRGGDDDRGEATRLLEARAANARRLALDRTLPPLPNYGPAAMEGAAATGHSGGRVAYSPGRSSTGAILRPELRARARTPCLVRFRRGSGRRERAAQNAPATRAFAPSQDAP